MSHRPPSSRLALMPLGLAAAALVGCVSAAGPRGPSVQDVAGLEEGRILAPLASPMGVNGEYVVEFGPTVETRNVACAPHDRGVFACTFQTRTMAFGAGQFSAWTYLAEVVVRSRGRWWFRSDRP